MRKRMEKMLAMDQKKLMYICLALFLVSLVPLLYLSGYVHASGDDYGYGAEAHATWLKTHSLFQTFKTAMRTTRRYYYGWQGTWFTIFLMALQPEVFSPHAYWIVPWIMLGINIASTSLLTHYFIVKKLNFSKAAWGCADILLLISMIQFFPRTKSAIFWWNGTVHYIVPYSLAMLAVYGMFSFMDTKKIRHWVLCCICMFCLGGSSYLAPLFALIVLFYLLLFIGRRKRHLLWLLVPAAIETAGLAVSFLAPGNKHRGGEEFGFHWSLVIQTILESFKEGFLSVAEYMRSSPAVFFLFLIIAMLFAEEFMRKEIPVHFPFPFLFVGMMFCLYCAMYAPGIYAGVEVSGGVPNTIFQVFLLTFFADLIYVSGWLCEKWKKKSGQKSVLKIRTLFVPLICIGLLLIYMNKGTLKNSVFFICTSYIASGQAADYKAQMEERLELLLDPVLEEVELPEMNPEQGPLMHMEVMENPDAWTNMVAEQFFQKKRIVQVPRIQK